MPAHKVGRLWRFRAMEVDEWVRGGSPASSGDDVVPGSACTPQLSVAADSLNDLPTSERWNRMNDAVATSPGRYALSFTTGALLARESSLLALLYIERHDWEQVRDEAVETNLLQARTHSTSVRLVRETVKRLSTLTDDEISLLVEATGLERAHLMWAAACRRYELIAEFAEEVLRERYLTLASTLGYEDFDSYVRTRALWHEELAAIRLATLQKLRSNMFKMLKEAELLSEAGYIMPAVLSERVAARLGAFTPSDLRFFPTQTASERETAS